MCTIRRERSRMKIAVVTGASSGLGREFVRQLPHCMKQLDEIWVLARRADRLRKLAGKSPVPVRCFPTDLTHKKGLKVFQKALAGARPDIRVLINCAGYGKVGSSMKGGLDAQTGMIDLNCRALTRMTLLCIPHMKPGARIINLASAAAFSPQPGFNIYAATKAYVLSFSRGLNAELKGRQISVTAVCPGPVDTEFFLISGSNNSTAKRAVMAKPSDVVTKALRDAKKRKELSIYGLPMKGAYLACRLLPHRMIIRAMQYIG